MRESWFSLDGPWDFAFEAPASNWRGPEDVRWQTEIVVPFAPETAASGLGDTNFHEVVWYRRSFEVPRRDSDHQLILRFEAVDYTATVWVNGVRVGSHEGGYTPFSFDISSAAQPGTRCEVVVRAHDDPHDLAKPRGKQDWQLQPHSIWYPRTTGIWQTVWLEHVPASAIEQLTLTPHLARWELGMDAACTQVPAAGATLTLTMSSRGRVLAADSYTVIEGVVSRRVALSDPGIDDYRNELLWSPRSPNLIDLELELRSHEGRLLDRVTSYTALRSVGRAGDRIVLNDRPLQLRMVLDQGYWPDSGLTPPNDEALRRDIELTQAMGFNGARKHQKVEDARYYYWADRLGLLVWAEMPSAYRFTRQSVNRTVSQWTEVLQRDLNHPSIIAWVPLNESWGTPNLTSNKHERDFVEALYHLTKTLDPSRLVVGNDGWEAVATDIIGIHDYDRNAPRLAHRYRQERLLERLERSERPGGRVILLGASPEQDIPIVLSEFGGITLADDEARTWGYTRSYGPDELLQSYRALIEAVRSIEALSGFCYTQLSDTYQEANGLLYADRTPKVPLHEISTVTTGRLSGLSSADEMERLELERV